MFFIAQTIVEIPSSFERASALIQSASVRLFGRVIASKMLCSPARSNAKNDDNSIKNINNARSNCSACNIIINELLDFVSEKVPCLRLV